MSDELSTNDLRSIAAFIDALTAASTETGVHLALRTPLWMDDEIVGYVDGNPDDGYLFVKVDR